MAETDVILTPDQRVRVFISSTLEELAAERAVARRAITRLHLVPVWYESGARPHPPRSMYPTGQPWEELEAHYRQDSLDQVRAHLGHEQLELAHAKGTALSFAEALDLASVEPDRAWRAGS